MTRGKRAPKARGGERRRGLRLDHIGIAVRDLRAARGTYARILGIEPSPIEEVPGEKVRVSFFDLGGCRLELLEAAGPGSPVEKFLASGRSGVHHVSILLDSTRGRGLAEALARLQREGVEVVGDAGDSAGGAIRRGSGGTDVLFVHPRSAEGVLIEFSTRSAKKARKEP